MIRGIADGSFGIEVAKLADLPTVIISRSRVLVEEFSQENRRIVPAIEANSDDIKVENVQLRRENERLIVKVKKIERIAQLLGQIDFENLSPKKAFDLLWDLKLD
jgi:DNA mismatch repair protein MutS